MILALFYSLLSLFSLLSEHSLTAAALKRNTGGLKLEIVDLIEKTFQKPAHLFPEENSARISIPRKEVVRVNDKIINPFMGISTLIFFQKGSNPNVELMCMGDAVIRDEEIQPTLSYALANGINITALHNHTLFESPRLYFFHFDIEGDASQIIRKVNGMIETMEKSSSINLNGEKEAPSSIDAKPLEKWLGQPAESQKGMHKFAFGRPFQAKCNCMVGKGMGVASWAAFQGTNSDAIMTGDFALLEDEVQPVLKALDKAKIKILAIHNHMLEEKPRLVSVHFMGIGNASDLAQGFSQALAATKTTKNPQPTIRPYNQKNVAPQVEVRPMPNQPIGR